LFADKFGVCYLCASVGSLALYVYIYMFTNMFDPGQHASRHIVSATHLLHWCWRGPCTGNMLMCIVVPSCGRCTFSCRSNRCNYIILHSAVSGESFW